MLLLEFIVTGKPISQQTRLRANLQRWKQFVRLEASKHWHDPPSSDSLRFVVTYFHATEKPLIDDDNMIKPLRDALIGLVYNDDKQITDSATRLTPLTSPVRLTSAPRIVWEALAVGIPFLYIKVETAPDHSELLR
jgi:Holliday junction resolvase RusA-like endonuclease